MAKEKLHYDITADTRKLQKNFRDAGRAFDKLNKKAQKVKQTNTIFKKSINILKNKISIIGTAVLAVAKLGHSLLKGAQDAVKLEEAFGNINTLIDGPGGLTESTKKAIVEQSKLYGQDAQTNAKAYYDIISAGITNQEKALKVLEQANKVAIAGNTSVAKATDILTTTLNSYGAGVYSATEASDKLFQTAKLGKTNFDLLSSSMGRLFPIASALGITLDEVGASVATATAKGGKTSEVVSQAVQLMNRITQAKGAEAEAVLKKWGVGFDQATLQTKGFIQMLKDLRKASKDNASDLQKVIGSAEAMTLFFSLTSGEGKLLTENLNKLKKSAGSTKEGLDDMSDTMKQKLNKALQENKDAWREASKGVNEWRLAYLKTIKAIPKGISALSRFNNYLKKDVKDYWGERIKSLTDSIKQLKAFQNTKNFLGKTAPATAGKLLSPGIKRGAQNVKDFWGPFLKFLKSQAPKQTTTSAEEKAKTKAQLEAREKKIREGKGIQTTSTAEQLKAEKERIKRIEKAEKEKIKELKRLEKERIKEIKRAEKEKIRALKEEERKKRDEDNQRKKTKLGEESGELFSGDAFKALPGELEQAAKIRIKKLIEDNQRIQREIVSTFDAGFKNQTEKLVKEMKDLAKARDKILIRIATGIEKKPVTLNKKSLLDQTQDEKERGIENGTGGGKVAFDSNGNPFSTYV